MSNFPIDRIGAIQRLSLEEREWQPAPEQFLEMVWDRPMCTDATDSPEFRTLGVAIERRNDRYAWVLLEDFGDVEGYEELASASMGDETYEAALRHGWQALSVATGYSLPAPSN